MVKHTILKSIWPCRSIRSRLNVYDTDWKYTIFVWKYTIIELFTNIRMRFKWRTKERWIYSRWTYTFKSKILDFMPMIVSFSQDRIFIVKIVYFQSWSYTFCQDRILKQDRILFMIVYFSWSYTLPRYVVLQRKWR